MGDGAHGLCSVEVRFAGVAALRSSRPCDAVRGSLYFNAIEGDVDTLAVLDPKKGSAKKCRWTWKETISLKIDESDGGGTGDPLAEKQRRATAVYSLRGRRVC